MNNFPKIQCPFVRKIYKVNEADFKKHGSRYQLRKPEVYLAIDKINPGYEWVFEDNHTQAVEKVDGSNLFIVTEGDELKEVWNRQNRINPLKIINGRADIVEGVLRSVSKGYIKSDMAEAGELIGPKVQANPYKLKNHIWIPFTKMMRQLRYDSFHKHPKSYEDWSKWFQYDLKSRYYQRINQCKFEESIFAEGIVFWNLKRKEQGLPYMAKLRRDMFAWYYQPDIGIIMGNINLVNRGRGKPTKPQEEDK